VEKLYAAQRTIVTQILNDAKKRYQKGTKRGRSSSSQSTQRSSRYNPLIKYLSEPGIKQLLLKTENYYMQDNNKQMHIVTDPLYFVIEEKQKSVDLTDVGHELIQRGSDPKFFICRILVGDIGDGETRPHS
jgi:preprotein translocase subunit SecA